MNRLRLVRAAILVSFATIACRVSPDATQRYAENGTRAVEDVAGAVIAAARSHPNSDPAPLDSYQAHLDERSAAREAQFAQIRSELDAQRRLMNNIVEAIARIAGKAVPGVDGVGALIASFLGGIDDTAKESEQKLEKLDATVSAQGPRLAALERAVEPFAGVARRVEAIERSARDREIMEPADKSRLAKLEEQLKTLDESKLAKVREEVIADAREANVLADEKLRAELRAQIDAVGKAQGLSEAQIKAIQEETEGDFFGLLGAGGSAGLVGLIALLRTLGKSRGQKDIDDLYDRVERVTGDVARTSATVAATGVRPAPSPGPGPLSAN
ncbi:MAG: hypothetical protein IT454_19955 [Planctomycetes bacterium]|nr:hypothetical protein [Planctomycetota bacterium]